MYNKQLDTFLKVAETGSFSKAAQSAFISPTAVIQQINSLEQNLQCTLFNRSRHGVTLTEAGQYFKTQASDLISKDSEIRKHLQRLTAENPSICIGMSMMQKVRLLFDLWVLYSNTNPGGDINLVNLMSDRDAYEKADLIEGIQIGADWTKSMDFLKICDVTFGIGIAQSHPLYSKGILDPEDLRGNTVVMPSHTGSAPLTELFGYLTTNHVNVREINDYSMSVMWECSCSHYLLAVPMCMQDILTDLELLPCSWNFSVPYGFFSRKDPASSVSSFLEFAKGVYDGSIDVGIVPVFD